MTDHVREQLWQPTHRLLLDYVRRTLEADAARRQADAGMRTVVAAVDIERLFASIELLIDRYDQPWSPFVSTWATGLESFAPEGEIRFGSLTMSLNRFTSALENAARNPSRGYMTGGWRGVGSALEEVVKKAIESVQPRDVSNTLARLRDEMIKSLLAVLTPTAPVDYLSPLVDLADRQGAITVATLNYDRCVELAAEAQGVACDTAIETWLRDPEQWPEAGVRLLKLHGSIDWILERGTDLLPEQVVRAVLPEERVIRPAIVFGEGSKLRSEGPYLELLLRWARALDDADRLLVVGYSFRDEHVNESIARWFNRDESRRIVTLSPDQLPSGGFGARGVNQFLTAVAMVDRDLPNQPPKARRLWHVQRSAAEGLAEAIERLLDPDEWDWPAPPDSPGDIAQ